MSLPMSPFHAAVPARGYTNVPAASSSSVNLAGRGAQAGGAQRQPYGTTGYDQSYSGGQQQPYGAGPGPGYGQSYSDYPASVYQQRYTDDVGGDDHGADGPAQPATTYTDASAAGQTSAWLDQSAEERSKAKRGVIIGAAILLALIVAGVVIGVVVAKHRSSSSSKGSPTSSSGGSTAGFVKIPGTAGVVLADPNDPSKFQLDPRFHSSFYGFAYTPYNVQYPTCGGVQANVTEDIQLLSQLTTRIRMYGADCNQTSMVLQALQDTKANMTVWLAIYLDSDQSVYTRQVGEIETALKAYGTDHVSGITVGNEFLLDGGSVTDLLNYVQEFNTTYKSWGLDKVMPIGTADAGANITTDVAQGVDYVMANVHPWFAGTTVQDAAGWTWQFFQDFDVNAANAATNQPPAYIAETGWPTSANDTKDMTYEGAVAGPQNLQIFLDTFVCQANQNNTNYFFFEAFDEPWKEIYGGVEPYWGLMDFNKVLKNVTLPSCPS